MSYTVEYYLNIINKSKNTFKETICPYLINGICSNYKNRYKCCRNFPQKEGYCAKNHCPIAVKNLQNNSPESSCECSECMDNCCNHICVPVELKTDKDTIIPWLDMDCEMCGVIYSKVD